PNVFGLAAALADLGLERALERLDLRADVVGLAARLDRLLLEELLDAVDVAARLAGLLLKELLDPVDAAGERRDRHREFLRLGREAVEQLVPLLAALREARQGHRHVVLGAALALGLDGEPVLEALEPQGGGRVFLRRLLELSEALVERLLAIAGPTGRLERLGLEG